MNLLKEMLRDFKTTKFWKALFNDWTWLFFGGWAYSGVSYGRYLLGAAIVCWITKSALRNILTTKEKYEGQMNKISLTTFNQFYGLYSKYEEDTKLDSFHDVESETFQKIVAMGPDIVPLLIMNLTDSWLPCLALEKITGIEPDINKDDWGKFDVLCKWWSDWYNK
jgi:hypothetical protein